MDIAFFLFGFVGLASTFFILLYEIKIENKNNFFRQK